MGTHRYSSPAAAASSGSESGRGSIGSRESSTSSQPACFRAVRCRAWGCPPVTSPGIGSLALGTPEMASSSSLMRVPEKELGCTNYDRCPTVVEGGCPARGGHFHRLPPSSTDLHQPPVQGNPS